MLGVSKDVEDAAVLDHLALEHDQYVIGDFGGIQGVASECIEENNLAIFSGVSCVNLD